MKNIVCLFLLFVVNGFVYSNSSVNSVGITWSDSKNANEKGLFFNKVDSNKPATYKPVSGSYNNLKGNKTYQDTDDVISKDTDVANVSSNNNRFIEIFGGCLIVDDNNLWKCVDDFTIGATEVTNAEYRRFNPNHYSGKHNGFTLNKDNQPVVNITIYEAENYAAWLSKKTSKKYRLPTNLEWQYAANAGSLDGVVWERNSSCDNANSLDESFVLSEKQKSESSVICDDRSVVSNIVGSYKPNAWGLYDAIGNVWEMVSGDYLIAKGGSWFSQPEILNTKYNYNMKDSKSGDVGFRLVIDN